MRSATTADSSDSIAPSIATVIAEPSKGVISSGRNCGTWSGGHPRRDAAEPAADRLDRQCEQHARGGCRQQRHDRSRDAPQPAMAASARITASEAAPSAVAVGENVGRAATICFMRGTNSPAGCGIARPKKSRICVQAIRTAMPLVKRRSRARDEIDGGCRIR
jgi:hypothetical protein